MAHHHAFTSTYNGPISFLYICAEQTSIVDLVLLSLLFPDESTCQTAFSYETCDTYTFNTCLLRICATLFIGTGGVSLFVEKLSTVRKDAEKSRSNHTDPIALCRPIQEINYYSIVCFNRSPIAVCTPVEIFEVSHLTLSYVPVSCHLENRAPSELLMMIWYQTKEYKPYGIYRKWPI